MKVAVAQLNYTIGAFDANKMKIVEAIEKADGSHSGRFAARRYVGDDVHLCFVEASCFIEVAQPATAGRSQTGLQTTLAGGLAVHFRVVED